MKNQAIKGQSCLTLEKLSDNELETVFGGNEYFNRFKHGFLDIPEDFCCLVTGIFNGKPTSRGCAALRIAGKIVFGAVCYGIYRGSAVVRKLKRKSVKKEAVSGKQNFVVS